MGFMEQAYFLVDVCGEVLNFKLVCKLAWEGGNRFGDGFAREDVVDWDVFEAGIWFGAPFGEAGGADDFGGGEGAVPGGQVHMVFDVGGDDVSDLPAARRGDSRFDFRGEGTGGENGEGASC